MSEMNGHSFGLRLPLQGTTAGNPSLSAQTKRIAFYRGRFLFSLALKARLQTLPTDQVIYIRGYTKDSSLAKFVSLARFDGKIYHDGCTLLAALHDSLPRQIK
jgi:hypothetical protein